MLIQLDASPFSINLPSINKMQKVGTDKPTMYFQKIVQVNFSFRSIRHNLKNIVGVLYAVMLYISVLSKYVAK